MCMIGCQTDSDVCLPYRVYNSISICIGCQTSLSVCLPYRVYNSISICM